jgi:hypothetical protein
MVLNRLGDKRGTNLSNLVRFNEAMKTTWSKFGLSTQKSGSNSTVSLQMVNRMARDKLCTSIF